MAEANSIIKMVKSIESYMADEDKTPPTGLLGKKNTPDREDPLKNIARYVQQIRQYRNTNAK
jgi:hypothetical protein